jgi:integrase
MFLFQKLAEAKSFAVIKTASAAINQAHVLNLLPSPTSHQLPGMVRKLARRRLGSEAKNVKAPFDWAVIGRFATEFARAGQPPVRQMLAVLAAVAFAGFCRPSEVLNLRWRHVEFCDSHATITLERRKNMIYRESKVRISLQQASPCCPATLLRWWRDIRFGAHHPGRPVFPKFDGRLWAQGESRVQLTTEDPLPYDRLRF